jgi:hypothetical protein
MRITVLERYEKGLKPTPEKQKEMFSRAVEEKG